MGIETWSDKEEIISQIMRTDPWMAPEPKLRAIQGVVSGELSAWRYMAGEYMRGWMLFTRIKHIMFIYYMDASWMWKDYHSFFLLHCEQFGVKEIQFVTDKPRAWERLWHGCKAGKTIMNVKL